MTVEIIAMSLLVLIMANNTTRKRETNMEKTIYGTRSYWKAVFKHERKQRIKTGLMYIGAFFLFTLPVWMFLDWLMRGY